MNDKLTDKKVLLVYDQECPLCNAYCQFVRIKETVGELTLVDARESTEVLQQITAMGLDIDQGMVLKLNDQIYYGSDAIHALALISSPTGIFNRFNYYLFRSKRVSYWFYPLLRSCRNILLKILGKTKINNLVVKNNTHF